MNGWMNQLMDGWTLMIMMTMITIKMINIMTMTRDDDNNATYILSLWINKYQVHLDKFESDDDRKKHLSSIVVQYNHMITSLNELKHLRGLDSGEKLDPRDKIRHTAARVGLSVPKVSPLPYCPALSTI